MIRTQCLREGRLPLPPSWVCGSHISISTPQRTSHVHSSQSLDILALAHCSSCFSLARPATYFPPLFSTRLTSRLSSASRLLLAFLQATLFLPRAQATPAQKSSTSSFALLYTVIGKPFCDTLGAPSISQQRWASSHTSPLRSCSRTQAISLLMLFHRQSRLSLLHRCPKSTRQATLRHGHPGRVPWPARR